MSNPRSLNTSGVDMSTLQELIAQRDALDKQIARTRQQELESVISQVRSLIAEYGLRRQDIFAGDSSEPKSSKRRAKVAAKYRDPNSGQTWTGRGRSPKWLEGKDKKQFLIG
jgi:DNA-binding protein H-NS